MSTSQQQEVPLSADVGCNKMHKYVRKKMLSFGKMHFSFVMKRFLLFEGWGK
jgi:hypothetical protein